MKKLIILIILGIFFIGNYSLLTFAQEPSPNPPPATPTASPIYGGDFFNAGDSDRYSLDNVVDNVLPGVAQWIAGFLAALAVIFLIYAGILYLTAGGEEEKITEATKTAFYVLVGLLLTMFAYVLVYLFLSLFNP